MRVLAAFPDLVSLAVSPDGLGSILKDQSMVTEILVPTDLKSDVGLSVGRWFKRLGDPVSRDEPLVEIDTDNVPARYARPSPAFCPTFW